MSAETDLYAALSAAGTVTSIVGTAIYPDVVPQEPTLPAIAFARGETEFINTIHGTTVAERAMLELWCMAVSRIKADELADAVQAVCVTSDFAPSGRRAEFDSETLTWSTVLIVGRWS